MDIAKSYDAVVVGLGAMGSATFYHLAQRGLKVLGLDRFHSPHKHGSSHGETRLTRLAYFEHSDYVPLIREAHRQWRGLESITGKKVFHQNGLHLFSHPESEIYQGVMDSARQYGLELERSDQNPRPTLFSPDCLSCLTEPTGGYLLSQQAIRLLHLRQTESFGLRLQIIWELQSIELTINRLLYAECFCRYVGLGRTWGGAVRHIGPT